MKGFWRFIEREFKSMLAFSGILAFALSSVYTIWRLLMTQAKHPSDLYAVPAIFVETATAVTIWQIVQMFHKWSRSNQKKQDRIFYGRIMLVLGILVTPSLITSIIANVWEFGGNIWYPEYVFPCLLGLLCPLMAIVCAILGAIPQVVKRREAKETKTGTEATASLPKTLPKINVGLLPAKRRAKIYELLCQDLAQSTNSLAKRFGVSAQTIRDDLRALDKEGKITYKDGRVALRPQRVIAKS